MHQLKMPDAFASRRIQTNQAVAKYSIAGTPATIIVTCRRTDGKVNISERVIGRHRGPHIGRTERTPRLIPPALCSVFVAAWHCVKRPQQLTGANVKSAYVSGRHLPSDWIINDGRADDHRVPADDRRGIHSVELTVHGTSQPQGQVDPAILSQTPNRITGASVERHQIIVPSADENS